MTSPIASILGAAKYIPKSLLPKLLGKVDKRFNNYFSRAASYGYDINQATDAINNRFKSESQRQYEQHLKSSNLRPDEMASRTAVENREIPGKALRTAGSYLAGGLLGGGSGEEQVAKSQSMIPPQANQLPSNIPSQMQQEIIPSEQLQQNQQSISDQFPQLLQAAQKMLGVGLSPEEVYEKLSKKVSYRGLVKRFEEKQGSFLDALYDLAGGQQGQMGQNQAMTAQVSQKKDQFLQGLSQMSQMLEKLKGR